jgi:4-alpha-glucanotransferase
MTTTHDLPTVAGWWRGRDIERTFALGRRTNFDTVEGAREDREQDRARLWHMCRVAGTAQGEPPPADDPDHAVDAVLRAVARTRCELAIVPVEDLLGLEEQPNVPGTIDEHPNWRRRLRGPAEELFAEPRVAARLEALSEERPR